MSIDGPGLLSAGRRRIQSAIQELASPRLLGNIVPMILANGIGTLAQWLASVVLANQLGVSNYGAFNFGMSFCLLAVALSAFGMPVLLVRDTVQAGGGRLIGGSILLRSLLASGIVIFGLLGIPWFGLSPGTEKLHVVFLVIPLLMAFDISSLLDAHYVARYEAYLQLGRRLAYLGLVVILFLVFGYRDPVFASLAFAVCTLGFVVLQWKVVSRLATITFQGSFHSLGAAFALGSPLFLAAVMVNIYTYSDSLIIHWMKGSTDLGIYSAATQGYMVLVGALSLLNRVLYPPLCAAAAQGEGFERAVRRMNDLQMLIMSLAGLSLFVAAPFIIRWFFNPEYAGAVPVMMIEAFTLPVLALGSGYGRALLALGQEKLFSYAIAVAAVANVTLNVIAIPRWGITGAAGATLVSTGIMAATNILLYRRVLAQTRLTGLEPKAEQECS